ncbi:hypothetical protein CHS0354_009013 [Potamilus streckersoni]|nr:hypothetical protein CHS0354_009013 [Potamilus streckersoni]
MREVQQVQRLVRFETNDSRMGWIRNVYIYCTLIMCFVLKYTCGYDVHVRDDLSNSILFNASLGSHWSYNVDTEYSFQIAFKVFDLDSSTGHIYSHQSNICKFLTQNPVYYRITGRRHTLQNGLPSLERTSIPLRFYLHGEGCPPILERRLKYHKNQSLLIEICQNVTDGNGAFCSGSDRLLQLSQYIPYSILQNVCRIYFHNKDYVMDRETYEIRAKHNCHKSGTVIVRGDLIFCDQKNDVSLIIVIRHGISIDFVHAGTNLLGPKMTIKVKRETNNAPVFDSANYNVSVMEGLSPAFTVTTITATDSDSGQAGILTYTLRPNFDDRSADMFEMSPTSGIIKTTISLDRELIPRHKFLVFATDNGRPIRSSYAALTVNVLDQNDNKPIFEKSVYNVEKYENLPVSSPIVSVRATDADEGVNADIRYSIVNPSGPNEAFMIHPTTGSISTRGDLDRETTSSYTLLVQAADQGEKIQFSSTATVNIKILDENDNSPQFSQSSYIVDVLESLDVTATPVIIRITATDKDEGPNADIRFSITGGNTGLTFSIDPIDGQIRVLRKLDYEDQKDYQLRILAQDSGSPVRTNSTTVWVRVQDVNDNDPIFQTSPIRGSVLESEKQGSPVQTVRASDRDSGKNGELVYSISNSSSGLPFTIDPVTGIISVVAALNRETKDMYNFVVIVKDKGDPPRSASTDIIIDIRDVNDNSPVFSQKVFYKSISEDLQLYQRVITVTATDADIGENAVINYEITSGNADGVFSISNEVGAGVITLAKQLDYKRQSRYILTVRASDVGNLFDTAEIRINVTDTNKYRPQFEKSAFNIHVSESVAVGTSIGKVLAVDSDVGENGRITYELTGSEFFTIDSSTGEIATRKALDRELQEAYSMTVRARDNGNPSLDDTASVTIFVDDVNDNPPVFDRPAYFGNVSESAGIGTSVLQVHATDADTGANSLVEYKFKFGFDGGADFEIDAALGVIRVKKELDRETINNYTLVVLAVDNGVIKLSGSVEVKIKVTDVNDNAPQFVSDPIDIYMPENTPVGSSIAVIEAVDRDEGVNAIIEYSFEGGLDADSFELVSRPGEPAVIKNRVSVDYESDRKNYQILIKATSRPLFSTATINIHVQDVNDNSPELKDFMIIFNNFIGHFPTEPIGRIPALDPDVTDQNKLVYTFVSGNEANFLYLNETSGEITLDSRLNSDVPRNGTFQVRVSDGKNIVTATCTLYVRLVMDDMLRNSVTIRLNGMTSAAFLSPLYRYFVEALATIIHTDKNNIFVINILDDTDVTSQILNVTVSVRERSYQSGREQIDVFFPAEYLQEQIYLQRTLLANLSTLQVLPFDDNLCIQEPCVNFEVCQSSLRFGEAARFIRSDTMLFRPIRPSNGYKCKCPNGFTGMSSDLMCDVEVDFCHSNPCQHGGTCQRNEGGYTCTCPQNFAGDNCEINMTVKFDSLSCPKQLCASQSYCQPLIQGGFRCEGCANQVDSRTQIQPVYNQFCQLTTRSFPRGSFLTFPALKSRNRFTFQMKFATQERNGLLFYNGRFNEQHDFIALEIIDGQLQFSFSLGSNITHVSPYMERGVHDGNWHQVTVSYLNRTVTVTVGEDCDTMISVKYGNKINYTCAAQVTQVLPSECEKITKTCHRLLDVTGPLQIGGLPTLPSNFQIQNKDFVGCIKDFHINGNLLDLNTSVANNGTVVGCPVKVENCLSSPCQRGGSCMEGWGTYYCICPERTAGKDCSQVIDFPQKFRGNGYMMFRNDIIPPVHFPWYNGISFRTRSTTGVLMQIIIDQGESVIIELIEGYINYVYNNSLNHPKLLTFDPIPVNDGKWHYFEARWEDGGTVTMILDYGQRVQREQVQSTMQGRAIQKVYAGALRIGNGPISRGFTGCIQNVRVGNIENSILLNPEINLGEKGCQSTDVCSSNPCNRGAKCVDEWEQYSCQCSNGTLGPNCDDICMNFNPCENSAYCRHPPNGDYTCVCGTLQSGQYCENTAEQPCPSTWWGYPICGPCDKSCTRDNGFDPNCDKMTGACSCRSNFYRPSGSPICLPCDCYEIGSTSATCHPVTGQCPCLESVIGRRCDQCQSGHAEIRKDEGCIMMLAACPRNLHSGIWWDSVSLGGFVIHDCPNNADGDAIRNCTQDGVWLEPDLFNCSNKAFTRLLDQINKIESGQLIINTFVAKTTMADLENATSSTKQLFGNDLNTTVRILIRTLDYENNQSGLNLTSEQDSKYLSNIISVLSNILAPEYEAFWRRLDAESRGTSVLISKMETYLSILLATLELMAPDSPKPYSVISDNIVLGVDSISKSNFTGRRIPKYDNIVKNSTFDDETNIFLPQSVIESAFQDFLSIKSVTPKAYVGYILYKNLGDLLPKQYGTGVRNKEGRPMSVNSPVFTIILRDKGKNVTGPLVDPVTLTFKQLQNVNRTSPQCVFWSHTESGQWSVSGCSESKRYELNGDKFVECTCNHMTSYAILMDIADTEYVEEAAISLEVITYIALCISMVSLFVCFLIFFVFKRIQSNSNSIHINLVFVIFVAELAFLIGVNKTQTELFCRLIAIALHYFYMAGFSWLFVDILHLYRMLTEVRDINQGSMKFYYLIGYVIPGIIVSLAVGLSTDSYKSDTNKPFCWLSMEDKFIWSFAGPITIAVIVHIFTFVIAVKASCREKISVSDIGLLRVGLMANILVLLLWGITWVFGLLAVNYNVRALHYLYAIFTCTLGVCISLAYILGNNKIRFELKKLWFWCQGKKLERDDALGGTRSSIYSAHRSALAYRNDSSFDNGLQRVNVGISTTSTTSHSTSKSSGGLYKGEDYLRSTSTSTSGTLPTKYPKKSGLSPTVYSYDQPVDKIDDVEGENRKTGNDSDSDSEMSIGRASLDLASSHSSDEDDDFDIGPNWEKQLPKNKKIEEAKEQARQKKREQEESIASAQQPSVNNLPGQNGHWPGDPQFNNSFQTSDSDFHVSDQNTISSVPNTLSSIQPDVTLQTPEYIGRRDFIQPPKRTDSLRNDSVNSNNQGLSPPQERMKVQVLTHRGSISSEDSV